MSTWASFTSTQWRQDLPSRRPRHFWHAFLVLICWPWSILDSPPFFNKPSVPVLTYDSREPIFPQISADDRPGDCYMAGIIFPPPETRQRMGPSATPTFETIQPCDRVKELANKSHSPLLQTRHSRCGKFATDVAVAWMHQQSNS